MARFVLVHGGFSGAWIWLPLMDRLRAAGHVVEAFDLPGMGDDHTSASEVSLDSYAGRVCDGGMKARREGIKMLAGSTCPCRRRLQKNLADSVRSDASEKDRTVHGLVDCWLSMLNS